MLREVGLAQAHLRERQILTRSAQPDDDFLKGEAAGIRVLLAIPETFIEAHKDDNLEGEVSEPQAQ